MGATGVCTATGPPAGALVGIWSPARATHSWRPWMLPPVSLCHRCPRQSWPAHLAFAPVLWACVLQPLCPLLQWCVPVSGCWCQLVCLLPALCLGVLGRLTVSFCPSVLCSWTLLRKERYGFFVSSAHLGPSPTPVKSSHSCPEFSLQLLGTTEAGHGISLLPCCPSQPVPPRVCLSTRVCLGPRCSGLT